MPIFGSEQLHWFAIHTFPRHEKRVTAQLTEKHWETYLPLFTETRQWSDRHKQVEFPLFPCYTFVRAPHSLQSRFPVLNTGGVISFVGMKGHGIPIPESEIDGIRALLAHKIPFGSHLGLKVGQRVRVRDGCLSGMEGVLVRLNGNRRLVISVEAIGRSLSISVEGFEVEPL
jgi:transcription antitermination factor NusG